MRRILVDQARARRRLKRGGGALHEPLENATRVAAPDDDKLLLVHEVLDELAALDPQKALIVKLRFLVGFTSEETAALIGLSEVTVRRQWKLAKAWLYQALKGPMGRTAGDTGNSGGR
jgi:RNA polymerase sigma factor (TIGR02999 family)